MSTNSKIEWTESTWNPLTGCSKISPGCKNCYAERMAYRLKAMGVYSYRNGFRLTLHGDQLQIPLKWKKSKIVFVNSMSDLFHKQVPQDFVIKTFDTMRQASHHHFQILTKRAYRLVKLNKFIRWPKNVLMGVSVENADYASRIKYLKQTDAKIKFLSLEPLLGPISNLDIEGIDWVIVGGESGPGARPMKLSWVTEIRDQCINADIPFFFKQWGGTNKKKTGRILEGRTWDEMPRVLKAA